MSVARHPRPKELEGVPLEEIMKRYVGRFRDKKPDWAAFADADPPPAAPLPAKASLMIVRKCR